MSPFDFFNEMTSLEKFLCGVLLGIFLYPFTSMLWEWVRCSDWFMSLGDKVYDKLYDWFHK